MDVTDSGDGMIGSDGGEKYVVGRTIMMSWMYRSCLKFAKSAHV